MLAPRHIASSLQNVSRLLPHVGLSTSFFPPRLLRRRLTSVAPMSTTTADQDAAAGAAALAEGTKPEASIKRSTHPDFKGVEAGRPDWDGAAAWHYTKTPDPAWQWGQGGNDGGASLAKGHVGIDPHAPGRPPAYNYKLLISAIVPRPIGFLSTRAADGSSTNLAPFSYTNMVNHDPPMFTVGISGGMAHAKDTLVNLAASGECVLNMVSEHFVEAANATAVNAPYGVSEWALSGLHQAPSAVVAAPRVQEAVFAVECKVVELKEFDSRAKPGTKSGTLAILEGVHFWVREDAVNEDRNLVDLAVLRPVSRLGGITYGRAIEGIELSRHDFSSVQAAPNAQALLDRAAKP